MYRIGYHGPYILFLCSFLTVIYKGISNSAIVNNEISIASIIATILIVGNKMLILVTWNAMNHWLNGILKRNIKQPRPSNPIAINEQDVIHSKTYGMPSGHAQIATTNLVFLSLMSRNLLITTGAVLQTMLTLYQRFLFRMHSVSQLATGTLLGGISGYLLYIVTNYISTGIENELSKTNYNINLKKLNILII